MISNAAQARRRLALPLQALRSSMVSTRPSGHLCAAPIRAYDSMPDREDLHEGPTMKKILAAAALAVTFSPFSALAQEHAGDAALGAWRRRVRAYRGDRRSRDRILCRAQYCALVGTEAIRAASAGTIGETACGHELSPGSIDQRHYASRSFRATGGQTDHRYLEVAAGSGFRMMNPTKTARQLAHETGITAGGTD